MSFSKYTRKIFTAAVLAGVLAIGNAPINATAAIMTPVASGTNVLSNDKASIDASNVSEGYVMVKYTGATTGPVKLIIEKEGGTSYTYNITTKNYETFPLTEGSGNYKVTVYENLVDKKYVVAYGTSVAANITSDIKPFLYPNQYVNFSSGSQVVSKAVEVTASSATELDKVGAVYNYVVDTLTYDYEKAKTVQSGYLPSVDNVLNTKTGICFDYAAVMTAMLRSQEIPTKLVIGYAGDVYHAWISVYIKDIGWIDNIIKFDGVGWKIMDPTFASTSKPAGGKSTYNPESTVYTAKFSY